MNFMEYSESIYQKIIKLLDFKDQKDKLEDHIRYNNISEDYMDIFMYYRSMLGNDIYKNIENLKIKIKKLKNVDDNDWEIIENE